VCVCVCMCVYVCANPYCSVANVNAQAVPLFLGKNTYFEQRHSYFKTAIFAKKNEDLCDK